MKSDEQGLPGPGKDAALGLCGSACSCLQPEGCCIVLEPRPLAKKMCDVMLTISEVEALQEEVGAMGQAPLPSQMLIPILSSSWFPCWKSETAFWTH